MKTVLISGAYRGLGIETARQLAARGFHVFVTARRREAGQQAVAAIEKSGGKATFVELDVTDEASIRQAASTVGKQVDHLDVLINNAAIVEDANEGILAVSGEKMQRAFTTNALGPLLVAQVFHPLLAKSTAPRIVNVSSGMAQLSAPGTWSPAYGISKTTLNGVTVQLAAVLKGFAVNAVCPGWVRTEMGGPNAERSVEQGVDTIVWLATEAPQDLTGKFLRDRREIPW